MNGSRQRGRTVLTFMACEGKAVGWGFEKASRPFPESTLTGGNPCGLSRPAKSPNDRLFPSLQQKRAKSALCSLQPTNSAFPCNSQSLVVISDAAICFHCSARKGLEHLCSLMINQWHSLYANNINVGKTWCQDVSCT